MKAGVIIIGRNEGERLIRCLDSLATARKNGSLLVYVDSASSDDSVETSQTRVDHVIALTNDKPLSAARARNAGISWLLDHDIDLIQFIDGDCELHPDWLARAAAALEQNTQAAIVTGRLREKHPDRSPYNRLCDMEWDCGVGEIEACGGVFFARAQAIHDVGAFREDIPAGEEPELCLRLRTAGYTVFAIDAPMALHDADLISFSQWWRRMTRTGYAFALGASLHGAGPERHWVRHALRPWLWAVILPLLAIIPAWPTAGLSLAVLLAYPIQFLRITKDRQSRGDSASSARLYAFFTLLSKFPEVIGQTRFYFERFTGRSPSIIEHKKACVV